MGAGHSSVRVYPLNRTKPLGHFAEWLSVGLLQHCDVPSCKDHGRLHVAVMTWGQITLNAHSQNRCDATTLVGTPGGMVSLQTTVNPPDEEEYSETLSLLVAST